MVVLDCCAAMEMALDAKLGRGFKGLLISGEQVIAPALYRAETTNTLWKYVRAKRLALEDALKMFQVICGLVDEFIPTEQNAVEALSESVNLDYPVYDMLYLTLARRNAATLFTLDKRLNELCDRLGISRIHEIDF